MPPVRVDDLVERWLNNAEVVHATDVPPALSIDFDVAHVGAADFRNFDSVLLDPAGEVVATFLNSYSILCSDSVGFVLEIARSTQAVNKCAPETVVELVLVRGVSDLASIFECDCLTTLHV